MGGDAAVGEGNSFARALPNGLRIPLRSEHSRRLRNFNLDFISLQEEPLTQSETRLILYLAVLIMMGVIQLIIGLWIAGILAFSGAAVVLVVFLVAPPKKIDP